MLKILERRSGRMETTAGILLISVIVLVFLVMCISAFITQWEPLGSLFQGCPIAGIALSDGNLVTEIPQRWHILGSYYFDGGIKLKCDQNRSGIIFCSVYQKKAGK
ncbi:hypothetical protein ACFL13_00625 [Patescibacteria group bacterium]